MRNKFDVPCNRRFWPRSCNFLFCFSENSTTSLSSLVDMSHQTRIVALLIVNPQVSIFVI